MSFASWGEGMMGGEQKLGRNMRRLYQMGRDSYDQGGRLTEEGLQGFRNLDSEYSERLRSGNVLSPNLDRAFKVAQGQLSDTDVRNKRSNVARLSQLRKQSGGALGVDQIAELTTTYDSDSDQSLYEATNELSMGRAQVEMKETNSLRDRIMAARDRILGTGQNERDRGQGAMTNSLALRLQRMKAIDESMRGWTSTISRMPQMGGGGAGGGGGITG